MPRFGIGGARPARSGYHHCKDMRIRVFLAIAALCAPAASWGQTQSSLPSWTVAPRAGSAAQGWPQDPLPRFNVLPLGEQDLPLPRIGLPLPRMDLREPIVMREPIIMREPIVDLRDPSPLPRRHGSRRGSVGFVAPWPYMIAVPQLVSPAAAPSAPEPVPPAIAAKGTLVLDVQPAAAQVFIDGFYVGSADDLAGRRGGAFLDPGAHAIEIASTGYEAVSFNVNIRPNESVVYRQDLKSIEKTPAPAPAPASSPAAAKEPTTIYMIPGCYVGNVPPEDAALKPTCDPAKTQIFKM